MATKASHCSVKHSPETETSKQEKNLLVEEVRTHIWIKSMPQYHQEKPS